MRAAFAHLYSSALFWPWSRFKGACKVEGAVIIDLHEFPSVYQDEWNRAEVDLPTQSIDYGDSEIMRLIERGVCFFGSA
tara:strand:- start:1902 stop:2138 length:237 start_codon:yes stop_codon:yes gene_type:complete